MKFNQKDYQFYIVSPIVIINEQPKQFINTGWEYREDAVDALKEESALIAGHKVYSLQTVKRLGIDPDVNSNWREIYQVASAKETKTEHGLIMHVLHEGVTI